MFEPLYVPVFPGMSIEALLDVGKFHVGNATAAHAGHVLSVYVEFVAPEGEPEPCLWCETCDVTLAYFEVSR